MNLADFVACSSLAFVAAAIIVLATRLVNSFRRATFAFALLIIAVAGAAIAMSVARGTEEGFDGAARVPAAYARGAIGCSLPRTAVNAFVGGGIPYGVGGGAGARGCATGRNGAIATLGARAVVKVVSSLAYARVASNVQDEVVGAVARAATCRVLPKAVRGVAQADTTHVRKAVRGVARANTCRVLPKAVIGVTRADAIHVREAILGVTGATTLPVVLEAVGGIAHACWRTLLIGHKVGGDVAGATTLAVVLEAVGGIAHARVGIGSIGHPYGGRVRAGALSGSSVLRSGAIDAGDASLVDVNVGSNRANACRRGLPIGHKAVSARADAIHVREAVGSVTGATILAVILEAISGVTDACRRILQIGNKVGGNIAGAKRLIFRIHREAIGGVAHTCSRYWIVGKSASGITHV